MKFNKWTLGLAALGVVSLGSVAQAEEKMSAVQSALSATTISGYVDTSAQWNFGTGNNNNPRYSYGGPSKADGFNLNVVQLTIAKPLDEGEWSSGYRADLWFGPDANTLGTQSFLGYNSYASQGDLAIRQAYVALRMPVGNGLDWKIGVFDSILGYETTESGNNPNYTRSYGYTIEPTTHTGILATYRFNDNISVSAGIANTMQANINSRAFNGDSTPGGTLGMVFSRYFNNVMPGRIGAAFSSAAPGLLTSAFSPDPVTIVNSGVSVYDQWYNISGQHSESYKTYMGSIALTAPDSWGSMKGSTLYAGVVNGFNGGPHDQLNVYAGLTLATPVAGLKVGVSYDYAHTKVSGSLNFTGNAWANVTVDESAYDGSSTEPYYVSANGDGYGSFSQDLDAHAIALYATYQATEKLSLHARGEWISLAAGDMTLNGTLSGYYSVSGEGMHGEDGNSGSVTGAYKLAGSSQDLYAITATAQYDLWKNVISRLEFRWDHSAGGKMFGGNGSPTGNEAFMLAANVIYKF